MTDKPFSEAPYYSGYKAIRNQLRAFDPARLIGMCLEYLHQPFDRPTDYLERQPWCVMLLIKWILVDDQFSDRNRPAPTKAQTIKLLRQVVNLANKVRMPSQHASPSLFFRPMVFQQVLYQRETSLTHTGRQMVYFSGLSEEHYIAQTFRELTGLTLMRFLELALVFHIAFLDDGPVRHKIGTTWFAELQHGDKDGDIGRFLGLLSGSLPEIRAKLLARDAKTRAAGRLPRAAAEYTEQTPFIETPLLPLGSGEFVVTDRHLVMNCLNNFVYRTLRNHHVQAFMSHFGPIFEDYVRQAVAYTGLEYRSEEDLKRLFGTKQSQNLIDFLIADGDAHVFVDAKAAEMNYRATVTHDPVELAKLLDSSLLKAIRQAEGVRANLAQLNSADSVFKPRNQAYLLVITYDRTNIGNGRALAESVGLEAIQAAVAGLPAGLQIPIDNMHFLTIDDFERLVAQVGAGTIGLVEALERAKSMDADPTTRSFLFEQRLTAWGMGDTFPDYLIDKTQQALHQIAASLRSTSPADVFLRLAGL